MILGLHQTERNRDRDRKRQWIERGGVKQVNRHTLWKPGRAKDRFRERQWDRVRERHAQRETGGEERHVQRQLERLRGKSPCNISTTMSRQSHRRPCWDYDAWCYTRRAVITESISLPQLQIYWGNTGSPSGGFRRLLCCLKGFWFVHLVP